MGIFFYGRIELTCPHCPEIERIEVTCSFHINYFEFNFSVNFVVITKIRHLKCFLVFREKNYLLNSVPSNFSRSAFAETKSNID